MSYTNPGPGSGSSAGVARPSPTSPAANPGGGAFFRERKRRTYRAWNSDELTRLRALLQAKTPHAECAAIFGRTESSIAYASKEFRLGIPRRPRTAEELRTIVRLVVAGSSAAAIAREINRPVQTVRNWVKRVRAKLRERGAL